MAKIEDKEKLQIVEEVRQYKTVPLDVETHEQLLALCEHFGFGKRGQGAMVRKLVKPAYEFMLQEQSLPKQDETNGKKKVKLPIAK